MVANVDAMLLASLSLSSGITGGDPILLVPSLRWPSLRDEYREVDLREALWRLHDLLPRRSRELRSFLAQAQLGNLALDRMDDQQVLALLRHSLRAGRLRAVRQGKPSSASSDATAGLRRLVRQLERETRGKLSHRGRSYKLVVGDDLARTPNRDAYTVVAQTDARAVLDGLANQPASAAALLREAASKLSRDWRPPFSHPEGLVLLRRLPAVASAPKEDGPALTPSQLKALLDQATLKIHVVDLAGVPQEGLAYRIDMPDGGSAQGELDQDGCASAKSSAPGIFTVRFPDLDGGDWEGDGALELPAETERSQASKHAVKQGERLPTIARAEGFARWETVWDFPGNADLRELRGNPYILREGDQVAIPSKLPRVAEVPGGTAEYVVQRAAEILRVRFAEAEATDGEPVMFRAVPDAGTEMFEGQLADDGTMEVDLPPDTTKVTVELYCGDGDDPFVTYELDVGHMDPCSDATGIQMRLANLGYYDGEIDGDIGIVTRSAISRFRSEYGLPLADEIDDDLRKALAWVHDDDDDTDECEADQTTAAEVVADDGSDEQDEGEGDGDAEEEPTDEPDEETAIAQLDQEESEEWSEEPEEWPPEEWGGELVAQPEGDAEAATQPDEDGSEEPEGPT